MVERGMKPEDLPVQVQWGSKIPADMRSTINAENLLGLGLSTDLEAYRSRGHRRLDVRTYDVKCKTCI